MEPPALNPYQAPRAELEPELPLASAGLARLGQRFWGAFVDGGLRLVAHSTVYLGLSRRQVISAGGNVLTIYLRMGVWGHIAGAVVLGLALAQWSFITRRGQSLGKMAARSCIVRMNGAPAGFIHGVVLRNWALAVPGLALPFLGQTMNSAPAWALAVLGFVDVLFIFGAGRRCLHDLLAGTRVIDVTPPLVGTAAQSVSG
jgi:uncharacterized RDD family membrane protein YckC